MKHSISILVAIAISSATSCYAQSSSPISYPGSNWSSLMLNPSPISGTPEDDNILLQGSIEQGIVWKKFSNDWMINTYASVGYSVDRNELAYNNKIVPALGVKFQRPWENGNIDIGVQIAHQHNFSGVTTGPSSGTGVQAYVQYWTGWNLRK